MGEWGPGGHSDDHDPAADPCTEGGNCTQGCTGKSFKEIVSPPPELTRLSSSSMPVLGPPLIKSLSVCHCGEAKTKPYDNNPRS